MTSESKLVVPARTTPTWEVELLISGALVIALFQLPAMFELAFAKWSARSPSVHIPLVIYGYIYSKLVLFALLFTFVLHIAARANWVALVGVGSIYPDGPRWENHASGVIAKRMMKRLHLPMDEAIERADNRATLIFSYGILTAQLSVAILVISLIAIGISRVLALFMDERWTLLVAAAAFALPPMLVSTLDSIFGKRLPAGHWFSRFLERALTLASWVNGTRYAQPLLASLTTRVGGRRGGLVLALVLGLVLMATIVDTLSKVSDFSLLRSGMLTEQNRSTGAHAIHYAQSRKQSRRYSNAPYIPAEVVEGPYLRLFVPYAPERHDAMMLAQCVPSVAVDVDASVDPMAAMRATDQQERRAEAERMACFGRQLAITLDGLPLTGQRYERHRDAHSGHDGALAMIDVRNLTNGRHELAIARHPRAVNALRFNVDSPAPPDRIIFWK